MSRARHSAGASPARWSRGRGNESPDGDSAGENSSGGDDAPYVTVVVDHQLGLIESYGPLTARRAVRILTDLRALLAADGIADVSVTACPLHGPGRPVHPADP